jgi:hypothetical protein
MRGNNKSRQNGVESRRAPTQFPEEFLKWFCWLKSADWNQSFLKTKSESRDLIHWKANRVLPSQWWKTAPPFTWFWGCSFWGSLDSDSAHWLGVLDWIVWAPDGWSQFTVAITLPVQTSSLLVPHRTHTVSADIISDMHGDCLATPSVSGQWSVPSTQRRPVHQKCQASHVVWRRMSYSVYDESIWRHTVLSSVWSYIVQIYKTKNCILHSIIPILL